MLIALSGFFELPLHLHDPGQVPVLVVVEKPHR